jgi:hypothetical protein
MSRSRFASLIVLLLVSAGAAQAAGTACAARCFLCDCAAFDRAFLPALVYSDQGDLQMTVAAIRVLDVRMSTFRIACYQDALPGTAGPADLQAVSQRIVAADKAAATYSDVAGAHKLLREIPPYMVDMRTIAGETYYLDPLFRLLVILDEMNPLIVARTPETLMDTDLGNLKDLAAEAGKELATAQGGKLDGPQFGLTSDDTDTVQQGLTDEGTDLTALTAALQAGDKRTALSSAHALKPVWQDLMRPFGDFGAVKIEAYKLKQVPSAPGLEGNQGSPGNPG